MEIRNVSATPYKSNQLRNVNTVYDGSLGTSPHHQGKFEVIVFVVNADMNITANNFYI